MTPAAPEPTTMASNKAVSPDKVLAFSELPDGAKNGGGKPGDGNRQTLAAGREAGVVFGANFGEIEKNLELFREPCGAANAEGEFDGFGIETVPDDRGRGG